MIGHNYTPQDFEQIEAWFTPAPCTAAKLDQISVVRDAALELVQAIYVNCPNGADRAAAVRHIREGVMTVNHAISHGPRPAPEEVALRITEVSMKEWQQP